MAKSKITGEEWAERQMGQLAHPRKSVKKAPAKKAPGAKKKSAKR